MFRILAVWCIIIGGIIIFIDGTHWCIACNGILFNVLAVISIVLGVAGLATGGRIPNAAAGR
jgi:hypothetical protein